MLAILKGLYAVLLADFVTGLVHWLEDSYWSPETPFLGKWLIAPNLAHHKNGQAFLQKSWWSSSWDLVLAASIVIMGAAMLDQLNWPICLFALIIANANQIHKWAHMSDRSKQKPIIIKWLQKAYIIQTPMHHGQHHRTPNNSHYCTVTNLLNPILDKMKFWRILERCLGAPRLR